MDSVVVSIRIKKDVKTRLEKEGIDVEKVLKDSVTLMDAQIEWRKALARAHDIIEKHVKPSKKGWAVRTVRADRRAH
jgi:hypothetical protein